MTEALTGSVTVDPSSPVAPEPTRGTGEEGRRGSTPRARLKRTLRPLSRVIPPLRRLLDHRDRLADDIVELRRTIWRYYQDEQRFLHERLRTEPTSISREVVVDPGSVGKTWMRHHPYTELDTPLFPTSTPSISDDDEALVARIVDAYHSSGEEDHYGDALWRHIAERHAPIHEALMRRDHGAVTQILREPNTNHLFFGYEYFYVGGPIWIDAAARDCADRSKDVLVRFSEALGLLPVENPEGTPLWGTNVHLETDAVVERIEQRLGIKLTIQPVQGGFTGLAVGDRLLNDRMVHGAYYAHRARQLVAHRTSPRIVEIGAGLGYSAFYAHQMGLRDYTIVDLPMTNVAQAYFLGRMLGADRVVLEGESEAHAATDTIKIRTPSLLTEPRSFDLVVNADSLTEVGAKLAFEYVGQIFEVSDTLLSINHEANEYCLAELFDGNDRFEIERFPFWLRNGYVEEIVRAKPAP